MAETVPSIHLRNHTNSAGINRVCSENVTRPPREVRIRENKEQHHYPADATEGPARVCKDRQNRDEDVKMGDAERFGCVELMDDGFN